MKMLNSLIPKAWANDMPRSLFCGLFDLDRDLDTLFESGGTWWPAVEARTKDGELVLRCDLPGVDPSDIEVSLEGTTLTISGEGRSEREEKGEGRRFGEVRYGRFERSLTVPAGSIPRRSPRATKTACSRSPYRCPRAMPPAGSRSRSRATRARRRPEVRPGAVPPAGRTAPQGRARDHLLV